MLKQAALSRYPADGAILPRTVYREGIFHGDPSTPCRMKIVLVVVLVVEVFEHEYENDNEKVGGMEWSLKGNSKNN